MVDDVHQNAPEPAAAAPHHPHPPGPAPRRNRWGIWLAIIGFVAGLGSVFVSLMPSAEEFRFGFMIAGAVVGIGSVVLVVFALRRRAPLGLAVPVLVLCSLFALLTTSFPVLVVVADQQHKAELQRNEDELQARLAREAAEQVAIYERSAWLGDMRAEMSDDDFTAPTGAQLSAIISDPMAHEGQGIIVDATLFVELVGGSSGSEGLCLTQVSISPTDGSQLESSAYAAILDRGTPEHCDLRDGPLNADPESTDLEGSLSEMVSTKRLWVVPSGTIDLTGGGVSPILTLIRVEE